MPVLKVAAGVVWKFREYFVQGGSGLIAQEFIVFCKTVSLKTFFFGYTEIFIMYLVEKFVHCLIYALTERAVWV